MTPPAQTDAPCGEEHHSSPSQLVVRTVGGTCAARHTRPMPLLRPARLALALTGLLALSACSISDLQFRNDDRLSFSAPRERARVTTPFTVSWAMEDFTPTGLDGGTSSQKGVFAVFVDRAPCRSART